MSRVDIYSDARPFMPDFGHGHRVYPQEARMPHSTYYCPVL